MLVTALAALSGAGCAELNVPPTDDPERDAGSAGTGVATGEATNEVGAAGAAGGRDASGPPSLSMIYQEIYLMKCAICHSMRPSPETNGNLGGIRDKTAFYLALVGRPAQGPQCAGQWDYVTPHQPHNSLLVQKLGTKPPCGVQMPVGGTLDASEVSMITQWIAAGAIDN